MCVTMCVELVCKMHITNGSTIAQLLVGRIGSLGCLLDSKVSGLHSRLNLHSFLQELSE